MAESKGYTGLSKEETQSIFPVAFDLLRSHYISKCLSIATKLDIATIIGKTGHPLSTEEIVQQTGREDVNLDYLQRILRYLSTKEIFTEHPGPKFSLTNISQLLRTDISGQFLRSGAAIGSVSAMAPMWDAWGCLEKCVFSKTQKVPFEEAHGKPFFDYLGENAELSDEFNFWMTCGTSLDSQKICDIYAQELSMLKPETRFMDVGGGQGDMTLLIFKISH